MCVASNSSKMLSYNLFAWCVRWVCVCVCAWCHNKIMSPFYIEREASETYHEISHRLFSRMSIKSNKLKASKWKEANIYVRTCICPSHLILNRKCALVRLFEEFASLKWAYSDLIEYIFNASRMRTTFSAQKMYIRSPSCGVLTHI